MNHTIRTIADFRASREIVSLAAFNAINGEGEEWAGDARVRDVSLYDGSFWILNFTDGTHYLLLGRSEYELLNLSLLEELLWEFAAEFYDTPPTEN